MADPLQVHKRLLQKWRYTMNLIGPEDIASHFEDCFAAVADLQAKGEWVDLGSGAGFPGISLATLNPQAKVYLVESRHKRCVFLRKVIFEANLPNALVIQQRTESINRTFDGVISRAYKPPKSYLSDAKDLCKSTGQTVLLLGDNAKHTGFDDWNVKSKYRYPVGKGFRQRWILTPKM